MEIKTIGVLIFCLHFYEEFYYIKSLSVTGGFPITQIYARLRRSVTTTYSNFIRILQGLVCLFVTSNFRNHF